MVVFDYRSGGHGHLIAFGFVVAVFFLTTGSTSRTQFVRLKCCVLFRFTVPVLFVCHLIHLVFDPFFYHVLLMVVHEPINIRVLATGPVHRAINPRLSRCFSVVGFRHQQRSSAVSAAFGYARTVDPPLFGPFLSGRRSFRISDRRRPSATHSVWFGSCLGRGRPCRGTDRYRPLWRRRCRLALSRFPQQFVQWMTAVFHRWQARYVNGGMFTVRLFTGPNVDHCISRLFAAGRFDFTRPYAILNFRISISGSPTTTSHTDKLNK